MTSIFKKSTATEHPVLLAGVVKGRNWDNCSNNASR